MGVVGLIVAFIAPKIPGIFSRQRDLWTDKLPHWYVRIFFGGVKQFAKFWHRYEIHGFENLRKSNCLLVGYHSRCTLDGVYATAFVEPTTIISPIFFAVPFSNIMFETLHCVSSHSKGMSTSASFVNTVTKGDRPTLLFPGGHYECYKPVSNKYKVMWKELPGYARILLEEPTRPGQDTVVVPFYTHDGEGIYATSDWWYDYSGKEVLKNFREFENGNMWLLPLLMPKTLAALGMILLPRPVKLDLHFGSPLTPRRDEDAVQFAKRVKEATQSLIDDVREKAAINGDQDNRTILSMLLRYPVYTTYALLQNTFMWSTFLFLNMGVVPVVMIAAYMYNRIFSIKSKRVHEKVK